MGKLVSVFVRDQDALDRVEVDVPLVVGELSAVHFEQVTLYPHQGEE